MKRVWFGPKMIEGLLYAKALGTIDTLFTKEPVELELPHSLIVMANKSSENNLQTIVDILYEETKSLIEEIDFNDILFYALPTTLKSCIASNFNRIESNRLKQRILFSRAVSVPPSQSFFCNGNKIVAQYNNTSGGTGTFLINNVENYSHFLREKSEPDIVSDFIENAIPLSVQMYVTKEGILWSTPCVQLCKRVNLSYYDQFLFRGVDYSAYKQFPQAIKNKIFDFIAGAAEVVYKNMEIGWVGIDFLIDKTSNLYFCELNNRLHASTASLTLAENEFYGRSTMELFFNNKIPNGPMEVDISYYYIKVGDVAQGKELETGIYNSQGKKVDNLTYANLSFKSLLLDHFMLIRTTEDHNSNNRKTWATICCRQRIFDGSCLTEKFQTFLKNLGLNNA